MRPLHRKSLLRDPLIAATIVAVALVLLIVATADAQQPAELWSRCTPQQYLFWNGAKGEWDCVDAPAEPGKSVSNDLRIRVLFSQKALERARADAIQAHARLLQTEQGLEYLQKNKAAVEAGRALAEVERRAQSVCEQLGGMVFASDVAQCVAKPTLEELANPNSPKEPR